MANSELRFLYIHLVNVSVILITILDDRNQRLEMGSSIFSFSKSMYFVSSLLFIIRACRSGNPLAALMPPCFARFEVRNHVDHNFLFAVFQSQVI